MEYCDSDGLTQIEGTTEYTDQIHRVTMTIANPGTTMTVGFGANLSGAADNESWRVDNFRLEEVMPLTLVTNADGTYGTLSYTHSGDWGVFDLDVLAIDESDGVSQIEILRNGKVVHTAQLDQNLGSVGISAANQVAITASSLIIGKHDVIEVRGFGEGTEFVRIDKLVFRAIADNNDEHTFMP